MNLKDAIKAGKIEAFIGEREPLDAPKKPLQSYIDASATPLESSKEGRSKSGAGRFGGCK